MHGAPRRQQFAAQELKRSGARGCKARRRFTTDVGLPSQSLLWLLTATRFQALSALTLRDARAVDYQQDTVRLLCEAPAKIKLCFLIGGRVPEPITTIGLGAIAAYLGKDGLEKLLGPTAGYLGDGLRDFTKKRVENIGRIFQSAQSKLGDRVDTPGEVPPRVLKTVINEGSYATEAVAVEYFGGVLASSRTEAGRDDRGARVATLLDGLSTYQLRTHYLLYGSIKQVFAGKEHRFGLSKNRAAMQIFMPFSSYIPAMELSDHEENQPQLLSHTFHGLTADGLIENTWQFGPKESLQNLFSGAPEGGIVCQPSALGAELFLWAFGHGDKPLEYLFDTQFEPIIEGIPSFVKGSLSTKVRGT